MTLCTMDDYRVSMADRRRVSTYRDALSQTAPGRVVCVLGAGHVPLGLMALQLGAERAYILDADAAALDFARQNAQDNGFGADQYITLCGHPSTVDLPERVEVLVAEPLSSLGFCPDTGRRMMVARERFLTPDGLVIPHSIRCHAALAGPNQFARQLGLWARELPEITGASREELVGAFRSTTQTMVISPAALLGGFQVWRELDFDKPESHREVRSLVLTAERLGIAHGVACCFEADFIRGVTLRTFPDAAPTPWQQAFTPFAASMRVERGDKVYVKLTVPEQAALDARFESHVLGTNVAA